MSKCKGFGSPLYNPNTYSKGIDRVGNVGNALVRILINTPVQNYRSDGALLSFPSAEAFEPREMQIGATQICTPDHYDCGC